jgi:hypothetical protein
MMCEFKAYWSSTDAWHGQSKGADSVCLNIKNTQRSGL